jgi:hypothetical protein
MSSPNIVDRREFLALTTGTITGVLAAGSPLLALAPSRTWAVELRALSDAEGAALMAMTRTIAPHDKLEDAAYALVVRALDGEAAQDMGALARLRAGIASLGTGFAAADEASRVAALKKIEGTPFFKGTRATTLQVLYSGPIAYAYFGYEGEAFSKGGYLKRGFNDLKWLPEVPLADSGPVPG